MHLHTSGIILYLSRIATMKWVWWLFVASVCVYFLWSTWVVYGQWFLDIQTLAVIRDSVFIALVIWWAARLWFWFFYGDARDRGFPVGLQRLFFWRTLFIFLLFVWSLWHARWYDVERSSLLVGVKYTLWMHLIVWWAVVVGVASCLECSWSLTTFLHHWLRRFVWVAFVIICVWFVLQVAKFWCPDWRMSLGFGPVGDYLFGEPPPLWYRTWPGGMDRWSGIFAWPNTYGYVLAWWASMFFLGIGVLRRRYCRVGAVGRIGRTGRWLSMVLFLAVLAYFGALILTLSRWALVAVLVQLLLGMIAVWRWLHRIGDHTMCTVSVKRWMRLLLLLGLGGIVFVVLLSLWKWSSTMAHITQFVESMGALVVMPRWWWLGSAGPAIHLGGMFLPENMYLQVWLDIWFVGLLLWLAAGCVLLLLLARVIFLFLRRKMLLVAAILFAWLLWLLALSVEGVFLHVWEDTMVNYLFLGVGGWLLGCCLAYLVGKSPFDLSSHDRPQDE